MTSPHPQSSEAAASQHLRALWKAAWPAGTPTEPWYPLGEVPMPEYLRGWAGRHPDKVAIHFYGASLTYAELDQLSDRFGALLAAQGIGRGDRVSVMLSNCPQFHIVFFGILKAGAIYCPVSPMSTAFELRHHLEDCGARAIVVYDGLLSTVAAVRDSDVLACVFTTSYSEVLPADASLGIPAMVLAPKVVSSDSIDLLPALAECTHPVPALRIEMDDVAALNYTGGTTGLPKGCIHTHRDMVYTAASNYQIAAGFDDNTVILNMFPEFWIAGENHGLIFPAFAGATLVLLARWDATAFMDAVQRWKVTNVALPMDAVVEVLEHPHLARYDLRSLGYARAVSFVKKLNPAYRRAWKEVTGSVLIGTPYGMTETHTADTFTLGMQKDDHDLTSLPVFVGLPVPGVDLKICDFDTKQRLPLGVEGEIWIKTPALMKGYWGGRSDADVLQPDGWFRTGDLGLLDEKGYLHYLGRRKEMIKVNGMSVFPAEIEAAMMTHSSIAACGVVAAPDAKRGQRPVAFVVLRDGETGTTEPEDLQTWCRSVMASYKVPEIRLIDALPLTGTGKVRKDELLLLLDRA